MPDYKTIEDVYESIGGFGRFQFLATSAILLPELPSSMIDMLPAFIGGHPTLWTCTDLSGKVTDVTNNTEAMCSCNGVLNGGESTIVSEWGLVCQYDWMTDFITSIQMVGMMFGDIWGTIISDRIGRKKSLYLFCSVILVSGLLSGLATSPFEYAAARFFAGVGISSYLILGAYYPMEFLTPKWRSISGAAGPWGEGVMMLALVAYFVKPWRYLCFVTAAPMIIVFSSYPLLLESPRWLLMNKRVPEAKRIFKQIAAWNRRPPVDDLIIDKLALSFYTEDGANSSISFIDFLKTPSLRNKSLIFMLAWFTCCLIYYGIGFNIKNLSGDPYWNVFYMAIVDIIGFRSAIFVNKWLGRRIAFFSYMGLGSLAMIAIVVMELKVGIIPYDTGITLNILSFIGKMCSAGALAVIDCFTAESYPTAVRSTGIGLANWASSFGGVIAPQMAYLGSIYRPAPFFVFGFFAVLSTFLTLSLNETNGKPIDEIIDIDYDRKKRKMDSNNGSAIKCL